MAELHVRKLPVDVHERLRARAAAEGRSMSAEAVAILRAALRERDAANRHRAAADTLRRIRENARLPADSAPAEQVVRDDRDRR